jgi:serine/threonine protein kinase
MATMTLCPVCNSPNAPAATICGTCGAALSGDRATGYSSALPAGTQLHGGLYTVGKVLGQGGFGITYLGSDTRMRRPVAVKEFFPYGSVRQGAEVHPATGLTGNDFTSAREKFADEARILARFKHPGIVAVYDTFPENNTAYMVMEYLRGQSLGSLLEDQGPLPEREAIDYIARIGEALEVVHAANLLHRDLKPDNIMRTDNGRVVLIDFGTARTFAAGKTGRMTTMVTPGYAPLEQYGQQVRFGAFTDVYALAATLYHLLTGQMPTPATDRASGVTLKSPHDVNPAVSLGVSQAIMWAMAMRIDDRPQSVHDFTAALIAGQPAARPELAPAPPPEAEPVPFTPVFRPSPPAPSNVDAGELPPPADRVYEVAVAADQPEWPTNCACCFRPADTGFPLESEAGTGLFDLFVERHSWNVPYCTPCLEHVQLDAAAAGAGSSGLASAAPLAGLLLGGPLGMLIGMGAAGAATLLNAGKRQEELAARMTDRCVATGPAVGYQGRREDGHVFLFLNRDFADEFARLNPS